MTSEISYGIAQKRCKTSEISYWVSRVNLNTVVSQARFVCVRNKFQTEMPHSFTVIKKKKNQKSLVLMCAWGSQ